MRLAVGDRLGHYILRGRLGAGGQAEVWAAEHHLLGTSAAIKVLLRNSSGQQARLLREGQVQAAMDHPNILPVHGIIEISGGIGLVLPLVEGPSLADLLARYQPTITEAVALLRAILQGLRCAHQRGLVHRDLKPGNILLDPRWGRITPRISDFGLVKDLHTPAHTVSGAVLGTPCYAAPEQLLNAAIVDHRADLFSLGIIFVELLTGERPFQLQTVGEILTAHLAVIDERSLPTQWAPLCRSLLAAQPDRRPESCAAVLQQLDALAPPDLEACLDAAQPLATAARALWTDQRAAGGLDALTASVGQTLHSDLLDDLLPAPHNLPVPMDAFVGRTAALAVLADLLEDRAPVTVLGPGGVGKTRLALHFADQHRARFPAGSFFCDLSEAETLHEVVFAVSHALNVPADGSRPQAGLGRAIADLGRCLIILDNFEQVAHLAADTLRWWAAQAPEARFVVTSRVLLGLPGEQPLRLGPLSIEEGCALFAHRARTKKLDFSADPDALRSLVVLLDALPLAIELCAARAAVISVPEMIARMDHRFRLLQNLRVTTQRQATLRATLDWSWALLEDWEQAALAQLSAFEGGFTLAAAEAVVDLDAIPGAPWAMDAVQSLHDKSLLRTLESSPQQPQRFGMLLSIHTYAAEKLSPADALACHRRHAAYFARSGTRAAREALDQGDAAQWWTLAAELDNLSAASRRAAEVGDAVEAAHAALALAAVLERRGPFAGAIEALRRALDAVPPSLPGLRAELAYGLGRSLLMLGQLDLAEPHYQAARADARQADDRPLEGTILGEHGELLRQRGAMDAAEQHFQQALDIARQTGDPLLEGVWLGNLGNLAANLDRLAQAAQHYQQALDIAQRIGDRHGEGVRLGNLGNIYQQQGQLARAAAHYQQALDIARERGDRLNEGIRLGSLGLIAQQQGAPDAARAFFTQALDIARQIGDARGEASRLSSLGYLQREQGDLDAAASSFEQAVAIARRSGDRYREGVWLGDLGAVQSARGRHAEGRDLLQQGEAYLRETGVPRALGRLMCQRAQLELADGQPDAAAIALQHAGADGMDALETSLRERLRT